MHRLSAHPKSQALMLLQLLCACQADLGTSVCLSVLQDPAACAAGLLLMIIFIIPSWFDSVAGKCPRRVQLRRDFLALYPAVVDGI